MKYKEWKEIQPLPCEVCKCCKYEVGFSSNDILTCKKYQEGIFVPGFSDGYVGINGEMYKRLHNSRCIKNYPSLWKKIRFRWLCWLKYLEDLRYHRFDD